MADLKHRVSGHEITVSDESVDFWEAAGYRAVEEKKPARKAAAKKAAAKKSE